MPATPRGRNDQLVRVLQILRDLDRLGGLDVYELADTHGATVRTIRRDLDALEAAGFELLRERDGGGTGRTRYRVDFKGKLAKLGALLDASHYLALRVAMEPGAPMRSSSRVFADLEDLGAKIEQAIGEAGRAKLAAIEACFHPHERRAYAESAPEVLWPLVAAIADRRVCRVTYRAPAAARDKSYEVLPLKIFAWDGSLYLVCHVPKHGSQILLNLQRLRKLRVSQRRLAPPADFDAGAFEHAAFGIFVGGAPTAYRLRFDAFAAPYIRERIWHPSQTLAPIADGGVELAFTCHASVEVAAWVQHWGEHVQVLAPASLQRDLAQLGAWLAETYRAPLRAADGGGKHPTRRRVAPRTAPSRAR
jgi:predicted DNA-binding transcriptional regulator YafY